MNEIKYTTDINDPISTKKAAEILGCSIRQIYNYLSAGKLTKYINPLNDRFFLSETEVNNLKLIKA